MEQCNTLNTAVLLFVQLLVLLFSQNTYAQTKPVLVVFPVEVKQQDQDFASDYASALQEGLSRRYEVYYGPAVEKELQKEYEKLDCTAEKCRQNVAIAFNGELIAQASTKPLGGGYILKMEIHNVFSGKIVESKTQACRGCDGFAVLEAFKQMGSGQTVSTKPITPSLNPTANTTVAATQNQPAIVIFDSNPSGAKVTINGKDAGVTPYQGLQHTVGEVLNVQLSKAFYQPLGFDISVNKELIRLSQPMQLQAGQGRATFALEPYRQGASLWLNGQQYGELPQVLQLAAGQYTAEAKAGSKLLASQAITVQHNSQQTVRLKGQATAPVSNTTPSAINTTVGTSFKDCDDCPEMVVIPAGSFQMGSNNSDKVERPVHTVTIAKPFAVGKYEVTFAEWDACVKAKACKHKPDDEGWGRNKRPVINVSWEDAQQYTRWISQKTGKTYRLLSEAEWEYVARAGSTTKYTWGDSIDCSKARYGYYSNECGKQRSTDEIGSFKPNAFGLYDLHGNVWEWTEDCGHSNYQKAPIDGSAWLKADGGDCDPRVLRGGSWVNIPNFLRSAIRNWDSATGRNYVIGFRIAQDL